MVQCINPRKMFFIWNGDKHLSCSSCKVQNVPCGLIKLHRPTMHPCTFPNNLSLPEMLLTGNLSLTKEPVFSVMHGIKRKYHRVHLTYWGASRKTTSIHSTLGPFSHKHTHTHTQRHKSETKARKDLAHTKKWNNAICSNVDGPRDYHTKWSKSERERQIPYDITYMWNLKYDTNEFIYKTETDSHT